MKRFLIMASLWAFMAPQAYASGFTFFSQLEHSLHVPEHVLTFIFVGLVLVGIGLVYRISAANAKNLVIPDRGISLRNIVEAFGQFMFGQARAVIGEHEGPKYFSFISFIFIFILFNNMIGLIPGFLPPTENLNTTFALGILSFIYYNIQGCKAQGAWNYLKHFMGPLWYMAILVFPIELISNMVRPLSLALRLRGNMFGDHLVLGIFSDLVPYVVPILFMVLGLLVSFIQAYVFTILSMVYISLAVAHHDHDGH